MFKPDAIDSLEMLGRQRCRNSGSQMVIYLYLKKNFCAFHLIQNNITERAKLLVFVIIRHQLKLPPFISSAPFGHSFYKHFLADGIIKSLHGISNTLALRKNSAPKVASCRTSLIVK